MFWAFSQIESIASLQTVAFRQALSEDLNHEASKFFIEITEQTFQY
jgi:hypothetical protein